MSVNKINNKVLVLYNEALKVYKNCKKPNNYIPRYIKKRIGMEISSKQLYDIIHNMKYPDAKGVLCRSVLEVHFANLMYENNIEFEREVRIKLINGKSKIIDFIIDDILIEVSGYAYDGWKDTFDYKMKILRESVNNPILILTYPDKRDELFHRFSKQHTGTNIFISDIYDDHRTIKEIEFINHNIYINKKMLELNII